jgi:hypothetical protein
MSEKITGMIGNVHAEVVTMPTTADLAAAMEAQGITPVTNKDLIWTGLTAAIPLVLSGCNLLDKAETPKEHWEQLITVLAWSWCWGPPAILAGLGIGILQTNIRHK